MRDVWLRLRPNDLLFFRGPEPFTAGETGYLSSEFPPSPQVMQGALRTALLEANGASLAEYGRGQARDERARVLHAAVGPAGQQEEMGIEMEGPYLSLAGRAYAPAPLDMLELDGRLTALRPAAGPSASDLGSVRLPVPAEGGESVDGRWLPLDALARWLRGEEVDAAELVDPLAPPGPAPAHGRVLREPKVGLARSGTMTARQGLLYTIEPLRLGEELSLLLRVSGVPDELRLPSTMTLGGEGRFVTVEPGAAPPGPDAHRAELARSIDRTGRFRLALLQPACFERGWLPDGLSEGEDGGVSLWRGQLAGVPCTLVSACVEKPRRVGGWDIHRREPKPLRRCAPAGSVYFFETRAAGGDILAALDGRRLGRWGRIGFGQCVVGGWE